jgi:hypothetical protein
MSTPTSPRPVKLIVSLLAGEKQLITAAAAELSRAYGVIDFISRCIPFTMTDYYREEMGEYLIRRFITFEELLPPEALPGVKKHTDQVEGNYTGGAGCRKVNLDPGYIALEHLILATNKKYTHRPYLGNGVYADLTLIYRNKSFRPLEWTYPDYASAEIIEVLNRLRERYRLQLWERKGRGGVGWSGT